MGKKKCRENPLKRRKLEYTVGGGEHNRKNERR